MIIVSLNIGRSNLNGCSGPVNKFPIIFEFENIKEWTNLVRRDMLNLLDWGVSSSIYPLSNMVIWVRIDEDDLFWEFEIKLKNIREFKKYLNMNYFEDIIPIVESFRREKKINDVLEK
jgi:hypothetical protein